MATKKEWTKTESFDVLKTGDITWKRIWTNPRENTRREKGVTCMSKTMKVDLVGVLRRHALLLGKYGTVDGADTAKLLREAAKAIETLRLLHWGTKTEEEPCVKT